MEKNIWHPDALYSPGSVLAATSSAKAVCVSLVTHRIQPKNPLSSEPNQTWQGSPERRLKQVMDGD